MLNNLFFTCLVEDFVSISEEELNEAFGGDCDSV